MRPDSSPFPCWYLFLIFPPSDDLPVCVRPARDDPPLCWTRKGPLSLRRRVLLSSVLIRTLRTAPVDCAYSLRPACALRSNVSPEKKKKKTPSWVPRVNCRYLSLDPPLDVRPLRPRGLLGRPLSSAARCRTATIFSCIRRNLTPLSCPQSHLTPPPLHLSLSFFPSSILPSVWS